MTATPAAPAARITVEVDFHPRPHIRRTIAVRVPDENQLAVWATSGQRFTDLGGEWRNAEEALTASGADPDGPEWTEFRTRRGQQATRALTRAMRILRSAMASQDDADWVEDMLLDSAFQLGDALGILTGAIDQLRAMKDAQAPTVGPVKKARRS